MSNPKTILLVEDNPSDVELARLALEKLDLPIEMTVAWDGVEAFDHLFQPAGRLPDLILLDLKLPRLDGFSVLDHIRLHERTREIPVIILTTSNDEKTIARSYDAGATGFIINHRVSVSSGEPWSMPSGAAPGNHAGMEIQVFDSAHN